MLTQTIVTCAALTVGLAMVAASLSACAMSAAPTRIELKSAGEASRSQVIVRNPSKVQALLLNLTIQLTGRGWSRTSLLS